MSRTFPVALALSLCAPLATASDVAPRSDVRTLEECVAIALAEGRYETGVGGGIELVDAQTARSSAEAARVRGLYDHQTAIVTLERAIAQELPTP